MTCKVLFDALHSGDRKHGSDETFNASIAIYVKDILALASSFDYNFMFAPRNLLYDVDSLAKGARQNNRNYIISWVL